MWWNLCGFLENWIQMKISMENNVQRKCGNNVWKMDDNIREANKHSIEKN